MTYDELIAALADKVNEEMDSVISDCDYEIDVEETLDMILDSVVDDLRRAVSARSD